MAAPCPSKLPENAVFTKCPIPHNYVQPCSARHVKFDNDSGLQCRFAYATWCPVCEQQERSKKVHNGGRRRSKSEGMDVERSDDYYTKATNESLNYNPGVGFTKEKQMSKKTSQQDKQSDRYSGNSQFDALFTKKPLLVPVCSGSDNHVIDRREKSSKHVYKHCENHAEPNLVYETWIQSSQLDEWTYSKKDRQNDLIPLHERYYYEVELLRNKLHKLRDGEKSSRSEQNHGLEVGAKRPRDNSPTTYTTASAVRKPVPAVTVIRSNSAKPRKSNVLRSIGVSSAASVSSDSDFDDSAYDEEDFKDHGEGEAEEDDSVLFATAKSSTSSSSFASAMPVTSFFPLNQVSDEPEEVDQGKLHPGLRASLFSHVPPYIRFYPHDVKGPQLPSQIQKLLKWKLSTITPVVVRKTIVNSNFKLVRKSNEWCGTWGKHMKSLCFKTLREHQKINHFPGTFQIGRKDRLWKNLFRLMAKFGKKEFGFIPRTYVLPQDTKQLRSAWEKNCGKERWIVKPPASARGTGIKVIHKWTQIPKKCPLVVQKYIADPYLINGSKFDLRLYVLVASYNPLRVYLYDNGLVRFASVKYSNEMTSLCDRYMHLTNYSINKLSSQYTHNEDADAQRGHKWSLHALWSHLAERGADVSALWASLVDLVIKTVISGESAVSQLSAANLASRYCSYELFGVDVLLDEQLKPWLLEVNISPSLHSSSPLDLAIKAPLVRELMNIAGYQIPNKFSAQVQSELGEQLGVSGGQLCFDRRLYTTALSGDERLKHVHFQQLGAGEHSSRADYLDAILADLTPDDLRHLVLFEDELTQVRRFQRIFPTTETHAYHQFFEVPRYYNMLYDAWEVKQCKNRAAGISLLESLCQKQVHLDTTQIPPKRTKVCTSLSASQRRIPEEPESEAEADPDAARARLKLVSTVYVSLSSPAVH